MKLSWYQKSLSRWVADYPFARGKWRLRRSTAPWLVAPIGSNVYIRVSGVVDAEWEALDGTGKEDRTIAWLREFLRPGMTVVDVGANIGYISLTAARIVGSKGRVVSFEPTPEVAARLRENIELNGFTQTEVVASAVTRCAGPVSLYRSAEDPEANTLFARDGAFVTVPGVTLDIALKELGVERVDLLKIDAEGAEPDVLRGAEGLLSSANPPILLYEANPSALARAGSSVDNLLAIVASYGYSWEELEKFPWEGETVVNYVATRRDPVPR